MTVEQTAKEDRRRVGHLTVTDKHPRRIANVLIVDDDVDSAIAVQKIFAQMRCNIDFALDVHDARHKIGSGKADLIVLDWMLDPRIHADQVIEGAVRRMRKFAATHAHRPPANIVTFSSRSDSQIHFEPNPFFVHVDHWRKPMQYPELWRRTLRLMNLMSF